MSTDLSTGVFSSLNKIFSQLIGMQPEQIAKANAPDFLKIAAMEQQAQLRKPPAVPPTSTVAAQVVNRAANPEGAQPQMQAGGHVHDYGVATLPYKPNYEHGGIVSFDEGGYADIAANAISPALEAIKSHPLETALALGAVTPYGRIAKAASPAVRALFGAGRGMGVRNIAGLGARATALGLAANGIFGEDEAAPEAPADAGNVEEVSVPTEEGSEKGVSIPEVSVPQYNFKPIDENAIGLVAPKVSDFVDPVEAMKAKGIDSEKYFKEREADTQDKLNKARERLKSSFTSEGLMNLGAAIASGKSANMMENIFGAIPEYTKTIKEESDEYADYRDKYESALDSLKDAKYASDKGDAQLSIAAKQDYDDKVTAAYNDLEKQKNAIRIQNAGLYNLKIEKQSDAILEAGKANVAAKISLMSAQLDAQATYAKELRAFSTKGAMDDHEIQEQLDKIESQDVVLQELRKEWADGKPTKAQKIAYNKQKQETLIRALYDANSKATLTKLGFDYDELRKLYEGNSATVTEEGNKKGGILSLTR